jgi:hypothetical protein
LYPHSSDFIRSSTFFFFSLHTLPYHSRFDGGFSHCRYYYSAIRADLCTSGLPSLQLETLKHVSCRNTLPLSLHFFPARLNNVVLFGTSLLARIRRKALRTPTEVLIAKYWPTMNTRPSCEKKNHVVDYRITVQLAVNKPERRQCCSGWGEVLVCLFQYLYTSAPWAASYAAHSACTALK